MKTRLFITTFGLIFLGLSALAQSNEEGGESTRSTTKKKESYTIKDESKTRELDLRIKPGTEELRVSVRGSVKKGKMMVELTDPEGSTMGTFGVKSSDSKNKANGKMKKNFLDPTPGTWVLKIMYKNASGEISLETAIVE